MSHVDFKELAHKIVAEWEHYQNLMQSYMLFRNGIFADNLARQHVLFLKYTQLHKVWCAYLNYIYDFKCNLDGDLQLEVSYLEIVGIAIPGVKEAIYIQVVFDGECDSQITMALNNKYYINVGGLPSGTVFFTRVNSYIIEGDEIVEFKS